MKRILIVDDEPEIRESLAWYLEDVVSKDELVRCHADPRAALDEALAHPHEDLVVVSDYNLGPGRMDGLTLLREIARLRPDSRRLLMSGYGIQDLARESLDAIHAFLPKPFDPSDLLAAMAPAPARPAVGRGR